jgi:Undecaprenyl-phosphate galactose phosphotransferase WbaP
MSVISAMKVSPNGGMPPHFSEMASQRSDQFGLVDRHAAWALFTGDLVALAAGIAGCDLIATQTHLPVEGIHALASTVWLSSWLSWGAIVAFVASIAGFTIRGHYNSRIPLRLEAVQIAKIVMIATSLGILVQYFLSGALPISAVLMVWLVSVPVLVAGRALTKTILLHTGLWSIKTLVLGSPDAVETVCAALRADKLLGLDAVDGADRDVLAAAGLKPGLSGRVNPQGAGFILIAPGNQNPRVEQELVDAVERTFIPYAVLPPIQEASRSTTSTRCFGGKGVRVLFARPLNSSIKSAFDYAAAAVLLVFFLPVFVGIGLLIRGDGGPAIFTHRRIGTGGRRFQCLKFRTMVMNSDSVLQRLLSADPAAAAEWAATQKLRNDPRITPIGHILRKTSLDELPQLINVLRGEMSLVGPRPIVDNEVPRYGDHISYYMEARPGMTGLWQVSGRSETTYEERVRLDVRYVREWSIWQDIAILLKTVLVVIQRRGAA